MAGRSLFPHPPDDLQGRTFRVSFPAGNVSNSTTEAGWEWGLLDWERGGLGEGRVGRLGVRGGGSILIHQGVSAQAHAITTIMSGAVAGGGTWLSEDGGGGGVLVMVTFDKS